MNTYSRDLPRRPRSRGRRSCLGVIAIVVAAIAAAFGLILLISWAAMVALGGFGVHVGYWICVLTVIVLSAIFGSKTTISR